MSRRVLEVELLGVGSLVRGHGSRDLCEQETGRPPVWIPRLRGWSCQESTARNVIARAEALDYDVVITGPRTRKQRLLDVLMSAPAPSGTRCGADVPERPHFDGGDHLDNGNGDHLGLPARNRNTTADPGETLW